MRDQGKTVCIYESPSRLVKTLHAIEEVYSFEGANVEVYVGFELTKMHEKHY